MDKVLLTTIPFIVLTIYNVYSLSRNFNDIFKEKCFGIKPSELKHPIIKSILENVINYKKFIRYKILFIFFSISIYFSFLMGLLHLTIFNPDLALSILPGYIYKLFNWIFLYFQSNIFLISIVLLGVASLIHQVQFLWIKIFSEIEYSRFFSQIVLVKSRTRFRDILAIIFSVRRHLIITFNCLFSTTLSEMFIVSDEKSPKLRYPAYENIRARLVDYLCETYPEEKLIKLATKVLIQKQISFDYSVFNEIGAIAKMFQHKKDYNRNVNLSLYNIVSDLLDFLSFSNMLDYLSDNRREFRLNVSIPCRLESLTLESFSKYSGTINEIEYESSSRLIQSLSIVLSSDCSFPEVNKINITVYISDYAYSTIGWISKYYEDNHSIAVILNQENETPFQKKLYEYLNL